MLENFAETATKYLELSNDLRIDILFTLQRKKTRISEIANMYKITIQESMRNFNRLNDAGLISKDEENYYDLTPLGHIACNHVPGFVFVTKNNDYFTYHNFGDLPSKFIQRFSSLLKCEKINGMAKILDKWMSIYNNASKEIFLISSDVINKNFPKLIIDKVADGIEFNYIIDKSVINTVQLDKPREKKIFKGFLLDGVLKRRIVEKIQFTLILSEKEGFVMFPTKDGKTDMREGFYGNDPEFLDWCKDYFQWCWNNSKKISNTIFQE